MNMNVNKSSIKDIEAIIIAQRLKEYCDKQFCQICPFDGGNECIINSPCDNFGNILAIIEEK